MDIMDTTRIPDGFAILNGLCQAASHEAEL
jgi:hypothetical protein